MVCKAIVMFTGIICPILSAKRVGQCRKAKANFREILVSLLNCDKRFGKETYEHQKPRCSSAFLRPVSRSATSREETSGHEAIYM